jgi:hypothetical protein
MMVHTLFDPSLVAPSGCEMNQDEQDDGPTLFDLLIRVGGKKVICALIIGLMD